jgi:hypothetical protein
VCTILRDGDKRAAPHSQYTLHDARSEALEVILKYLLFACILGSMSVTATQAGVTRIVIDRIEAPTFDGREFGGVGRFEKLSGRAFGEVDPADPLNAGIVFIQEAPRNARGRVEYVVDISIIQPVDAAKGNGTILYDVVNRGARRAFDVFHLGEHGGNNPSKAVDAGDAFLLRQGYTLVVSGWQADIPREEDEIIADYPLANRSGGQIAKTISVELIVTRPAFSLPIGWDNGRALKPYPLIERAAARARLIRRAHADAPDELIPREDWSFAACKDGKTLTPSSSDICLPAGFSPDYVYHLSYPATDPVPAGLGFAATRDIVSFLRYDTSSANPLVAHGAHEPHKHTIKNTIGFGRSQSGRFLKDLIYQGFNLDEAKRIVFDGAMQLTSGGRVTNVNTEFALPGRFSTALVGHYTPGDQFPFTYETLTDPVSGRTDGLLAKCSTQGACPKIMHMDSGTEPWGGRNSLVITDPLGRRDVRVPDNVRLYYFAGTQHAPVLQARSNALCQNPVNPNQYKEAMRALLVAMQNWITAGKAPPQSRFPSLAAGTLVRPLPQRDAGFPEIPGRKYTGEANHLYMNEVDALFPKHVSGKQYSVLVPRVDRDGNDIPGVRSVTLQVPLGTYTGWNLRRKGAMEDRSCYLDGSFIPFARYRVDRGSDPRPSLEERYGSKANYMRQVEAAVQRLQAEGFLLAEDAERLLREARERDIGI